MSSRCATPEKPCYRLVGALSRRRIRKENFADRGAVAGPGHGQRRGAVCEKRSGCMRLIPLRGPTSLRLRFWALLAGALGLGSGLMVLPMVQAAAAAGCSISYRVANPC